jgi:hypothetical protein
MESLRNVRSRRYRSWAVGIGLSLAVSTALADASKGAQPSGLMTFPNVQVINAPQAAPRAAAPSDAGLRAYVDPESRRLRAQSIEEAKQIGEETKAKQLSRTQLRSRNAAAAATAEPQFIYGPDNTVGVELGEESMVFMVARKDHEGLDRMEVTGKRAAESALQSKSTDAARKDKEVGHAH